MKEFTDLALDIAKNAGADYADMRIVEERQNRVYAVRRSLKLIDETENFGYGIRVLLNGAWGFASNTRLNKDEVAKTAELAVSAARASAKVPKDVPARMAPESANTETLTGPCQEDPFQVPNKEKAELILTALDTILNVPNVVMAWGFLQFVRTRRIIANTDGSFLDLTNTFSNPMLQAVAVVGTESQTRSYQGGARQAGFEFIRNAHLVGNAKKWAEEAVLKCGAEDCPAGVMDLILDPDHLALTMHESVGHPTELDRILGWEANMAGRSFINPEMVGKLKYGSGLVNFTVNNILEGGLGSWFYDDDGVKMKKFPIIKDGVLVSLGTTRETVPIIGWENSNGCCRADTFDHFPINRIPNLYMEPGTDDSVKPDDLIAGIDKGIYIEGQGSFSIDQMRNNFQFGGDMFWLIEGGKKTKPLKKVTYQAQTTQFWGSCDGIAGKSYWRPHGVMNCGKGEPMQIMKMTHGASYARFRNINVGGAKI
ncbi:TldD/PmbA family protein [bacterium]|nr:TldD/PmbA family protein [bacterium]